jgi:hypothetical protein
VAHCKQLYLRPDTSGEISGRLVPGGKMPENAFVFLKRVPENTEEQENHDVNFGVDVFSDDTTGAFAFRHVRPGKYVLSFGDEWQGPTISNPYEQNRYYRNSKDRNGAEVIELREGQKVQNIEFNIRPEAPRRTIHVTATWRTADRPATFTFNFETWKRVPTCRMSSTRTNLAEPT